MLINHCLRAEQPKIEVFSVVYYLMICVFSSRVNISLLFALIVVDDVWFYSVQRNWILLRLEYVRHYSAENVWVICFHFHKDDR